MNIQPLGVRNGGRLVMIPIAKPLPGQTFTYTQPDTYMLEFLSLAYIFTTSAAVGNRVPKITLSYQSILFGQQISGNPVTASSSVAVTFDPLNPSLNLVNNVNRIETGRLFLPPGCLLQNSIALQDVADQIQAIMLAGFAWPLE